MKKIIVFGLLLFLVLFSYTSKKKPEKKRNAINKYDTHKKQPLINSNNQSSYKLDEPIKRNINISKKQGSIKHFSRHRKGKIIYIKNYPKNQTITFE